MSHWLLVFRQSAERVDLTAQQEGHLPSLHSSWRLITAIDTKTFSLTNPSRIYIFSVAGSQTLEGRGKKGGGGCV